MERKLSSLCKEAEEERRVDLTAKSSPEKREVARETVAEEPRPMMGPLLHSIGEKTEQERRARCESLSSICYFICVTLLETLCVCVCVYYICIIDGIEMRWFLDLMLVNGGIFHSQMMDG